MKFFPRDFFFNIAAMVALYVSAVSLIALLFQYIDVLFPDVLLGSYDPYSGAIRFAIASLVVVFPLFVLFTRLVHQDIRREPVKREGALRKWLIYITLFIAGATIAGDLIALINTFLSGEITTRFLLKVLTILLIVGGAFLYYFYELKGRWEVEEKQSKLIAGLVSLAVLLSVVGGFFIIGSPATQRLMRADADRVSDLQSIQWQIISYWQAKESLPANLNALEDPLTGFVLPTDPETEESYRYQVTGVRSFRLCATFAQKSRDYDEADKTMLTSEEMLWPHDAGEVCFERTIDLDRFPPLSETRKPSVY